MKKLILSNFFQWSISLMILMIISSNAVAVDMEDISNSDINTSSSSSEIFIAPLNPAFVQYQEELEQDWNEFSSDTNEVVLSGIVLSESTENFLSLDDVSNISFPDCDEPEYYPGHYNGLVPSPIDFSYLSPVDMEGSMIEDDSVFSSDLAVTSSVDYPDRYDLREEGGVTEMRDQGFAGSCWTFGSLASLESYLMHNRSEEWDLSENHMKNTLLVSYEDGFDVSSPNDGGVNLMALAYLARWDGPVAESDDPYNDLSSISSSDVVVVKHLQETLIFPSFDHSSDLFKWAITNYGGIGVAMHEDSSKYFNKENNTYYCYEEDKRVTHAIYLTGWDDNFDRNKFTPVPPGDGAYIIKNSWGDNWGDDGYFYISYYDTAVATRDGIVVADDSLVYTTNYVFTAENISNYDRNYQYDPLGWCSNLGYNSNTATGANVFTASSNETLEAVSFYTTDSNSFYNISIYLDPEDGPINVSGPVSLQNGSIPIAGYHTVDLDINVSLSEDQNFSVVINFTTPGYNYPLAIEKALSGYSSNAHAEIGQSYMSSDGLIWTDISGFEMNACIKAFTRVNKAPEAAFIAERRYVHVNESVDFHDASLFSPESWQWDFGDNSTSTEQDPSHSYTSTGIYNVSLNASNGFGNDISTRTSFLQVLTNNITVNSSGNADFTMIQDAIRAASEGDTILVEPGTYTERLSFRKDNITLRSSTGNPADVNIISSNPDETDTGNYAVFIMADNVTLQNITVSGGYYGVYSMLSNNCSIIDSRMTNNFLCGLIVQYSYNNSILNCTIDNNTASGLYLSDSANNHFANNSMSGNRFNCLLDSQNDIIDTSNTIENKPIYYLSGASDVVIGMDSNAGKVSLIDCSNITIEDIYIQSTYFGIRFYNTTNSTINNCTFTDNGYGIYMTYCEDNTVSNSTLNDNVKPGLLLSECSNNLIYNNYFNNTYNFVISGGLSNQWNITRTPGTNIINGSYLGGNFWAEPDGTGWSQTEYSVGNGFSQQYEITDDDNNIDYLPLTLNEQLPDNSVESDTQSDNDGIHVRIPTGTTSPSNVLAMDSSVRFVGKDAEVEYVFTDSNTPVTDICFEAETNEGFIMATVNLLNDLHDSSSAPSSVTVYQSMEIVLGDGSFSSGIGEAMIGFSVSKEWLGSNNYDETDIHMEHFSDGVWNRLPTVVTGGDNEYVYFDATTTGFSPFMICADINSEVQGTELPEKEFTLSSENAGNDQNNGDSGLSISIVSLILILMAVVFIYYKKVNK